MQLKFIDFTSLYDPKKVINDHRLVNNSKEFLPNGIFSTKVFGNMTGENVEFSCTCKELQGKFALGLECKICESKVERRESLLKTMGFIDLESNSILSPVFYNLISKIIGKTELEKITTLNRRLDLNGNYVHPKELKGKGNMYANIGIIEFIERLDEILESYRGKSTETDALLDIIADNRGKVVISKLPVISHRLRPAIVMGEEIFFDVINTLYSGLINKNNALKELKDGDILAPALLLSIQEAACGIYRNIESAISGKYGFLRNGLFANRFNFTARSVIGPLENSDIDEIHIPYLTAVELYRYRIMNVLVNLEGYNPTEANHIYEESKLKVDDRIMNILNMFIKKEESGGLPCLLNRNPTISVGSILFMRITGIKEDYYDLTFSIPNPVLGLMAGDYDGDVLALIPIPEKRLYKHFAKLSPKNMFISSNTGRINKFMLLTKDNIMGVNTLLTL